MVYVVSVDVARSKLLSMRSMVYYLVLRVVSLSARVYAIRAFSFKCCSPLCLFIVTVLLLIYPVHDFYV